VALVRPLVAVVGRPNVGKSTLVNRLIGRRAAIVDGTPGVTRDRLYLDTDWNGRAFTIVDTGGLDFGSDVELVEAVHGQAMTAAREADLILFVVDAAMGLMPQDGEIADVLRRSGKPVLLVANKMDDPAATPPGELYRLGFRDSIPVSAVHGTNTGDLLDEMVARLPEAPPDEDADDLAIAVVGRPNAGKSTLVNTLLGEDRVVVSEIAGTTRDAIDTVVIRDGRRVRLVDTAGLRRRSKTEDLEYYGRVRALAALERADVAVLVIDATEGAADQDQRIVGEAIDRGCALVVALSKWDLVPAAGREKTYEHTCDLLRFASWAAQIAIAPPAGTGIEALWRAIELADGAHTSEVSTSKMNAFVQQLKAEGHTVSQRSKVLKLSYAVQAGTRPPRFLFFANHPDLAQGNFTRYVEGRLREAFPLEGTPVRIGFAKK
jgi:GTPase